METQNTSTLMSKIAVTQRGSEWMALVTMAKRLVDSPYEMIEVLNNEEAYTLGSAMNCIELQLPLEGDMSDTACVLFSEKQLAVLVQLVNWFDNELILIAPKLLKYIPEAFGEKFRQTGLIKRNLKLYAKPYPNSETPQHGNNDTENAERG